MFSGLFLIKGKYIVNFQFSCLCDAIMNQTVKDSVLPNCLTKQVKNHVHFIEIGLLNKPKNLQH